LTKAGLIYPETVLFLECGVNTATISLGIFTTASTITAVSI